MSHLSTCSGIEAIERIIANLIVSMSDDGRGHRQP